MLKRLSLLLLFSGLILCLAPLLQAQFTLPPVNISNSALDSKFPKIYHREGSTTELVIWVETDGTNDYLYFAKSTDGALTWSTPVQLTFQGQILTRTSDQADYYALSLAVDDHPYVYVVIQWRDNASDDFDIWYIRSDDLGDTWDVSRWVALTESDSDSRFPDVAAWREHVHVVYQDSWPGNEEIMYKRLNGYGVGGVERTRRLTFSSGESSYPRIAVSNGGYCVSVVYEDDTSGQFNIYYKHIDDYGAGPYQTKQLTFGTDWNGLPDIATSAGSSNDRYVYIVYQAYWPGNREIIYKRLDNFGYGTFNTYTGRLTYSPTESRSNSISFSPTYSHVHISYHDDWPGNNDIMYRILWNFGGAGFSAGRVSWGTGDSSNSTVAASGASDYVVWSDNTSGNYEIYVNKRL
jgi:hypothetical protein